MAQHNQPRGVRVVRESFWHHMKGYPELVQSRTTVREGHPLIRQFEEFFHPPGYVDIEVER